MSFVGLDNGEYREGQFGVDKGVAFADANSSETRYFEQLEQMKESGITFGDLGIDPKNEKYGPNGLLPGANIDYDAAINDLQSALDRYNSNLEADTSNNDTSSVADDGNAGASDDFNTPEGLGFILGDLDGAISLKYNDDYIYYDKNSTEAAISTLIKAKSNFVELFDDISTSDKSFYDSLRPPYDKFKISPRASAVLQNISTEIDAEFATTKDTTNAIVAAIINYSNGDSTGLDELLAPKKSPSGGGGGGDFGGGGGDDFDSGLPQPSEDSEGSGNAGDNSSSEEDLSDDEEMVIPTASGQTGVVGGSAMSSLLEPSDELLELGDDDSIPSNNLLFDSAADSKFLIPSLSSNSMIGGSDGIKKSGIAISGAIVAAASMAVGGKIVYDKKKTDSETEEESIDNNTINSNSDLNDDEDIKEKDATDDKKNEEDNEVFGKSTVGFKASLFDEGESDING